VYVCAESLQERELSSEQLLIPAQVISRQDLQSQLQDSAVRLVF
jgi:sulfur relay (sulfurtransferase) DsrF/TusC family protein